MTLNVECMKVRVHSGPNGQERRCEHLDMLPDVRHEAPECRPCLALGLPWSHLLVCLTCGWVACSDDSPGGHARAHYEETDHPVVAALDSETPRRWCYVHGRAAL
ncbi:UBP-type zinc finger domain-containing protein [Microbispora bryophytorum]|uniref:UBP-type zinc finger domain-containing protein n=1 Tax=Microbispora bryophytorum TaxID=1460882 RepID=UPI0033FAEE90